MDRREFLYQRKNRCVGQLLQRLEREVFPLLPDDVRESVRHLVRSKISAYHKDVLALISEDGVTIHINALAVQERDRMRNAESNTR